MGAGMSKNPVLDVSLAQIMKSQYALSLQALKIHTVGGLLSAWRSPRNHRSIEQVFETPQQARHAVAVCAAWLGVQSQALHNPVPAWWAHDEQPVAPVSSATASA